MQTGDPPAAPKAAAPAAAPPAAAPLAAPNAATPAVTPPAPKKPDSKYMTVKKSASGKINMIDVKVLVENYDKAKIELSDHWWYQTYVISRLIHSK